MGGNSEAMISPNGKFNIKFVITISMQNGKLYAVCIMRTQEEVTGVVTTNHSLNKKVKLTVLFNSVGQND